MASIEQVRHLLQHIPDDWVTLTTHRLDIYDESQAKVEFVDSLERQIEKTDLSVDDLNQLPTAYDYVRLGHQLSSVLEWFVAKVHDVAPTQVIAFASKTMPLLSVLRGNTVHGRRTVIYHDCALPEVFGDAAISEIYGYDFETVRVDSVESVQSNDSHVSIVVTGQKVGTKGAMHDGDCTVYLGSDFGSVLVIHNRTDVPQWVSEVQHVRRRECIASTPPYTLRMLQEIVGAETEPFEVLTQSQWQQIADAVAENTGSLVEPLVASSGLSTQYGIMMGLLDYCRQTHPGKAIQFLIPPNCYGGTNDQARRMAVMTSDVSIVDLPVDGGQLMTDSLERRLAEAALADAVPCVLVEIPTNPRVEVPDMDRLKAVLTEVRHTSQGTVAVSPIFIVDQTFCPNVRLLGDTDSLAEVQTLSYVSGSKFPSGGRCTGGYVTANARAVETMPLIQKHLQICDNFATPLQMTVLAESMPSMRERIRQAYENTKIFVEHIQATLPNTKISFIDPELVDMGFTPSVFSLDLPSVGDTPEEREENKRLLNHSLISHMVRNFPNGTKHCVSYGQLSKTYWTVPATSTQGTTKESDKDYIVRIALPPQIDMDELLGHFDAWVASEDLIGK